MSISIKNISFEFFPPKTPEGIQHLSETVMLFSAYAPHFFSVTFGAGGSTRKGTLDAVKKIQQISAISVAPHLSCIGSSYDEIIEILDQYKTLGTKRIVALRGDLPSGMGGGNTSELKYASELVELIRQVTGDHFYIEVAAYPEIHPQATSVRDDILNLKRKYEAGANSAITQYFFNPDSYFYYLDECTQSGIDLPIIPGIMPIQQFQKLVQFSMMCGAEIPLWIRKRLEAYGNDLESMKSFGIEVVYNLCQRLIVGGAPGLHFYTLNKAEPTITILDALMESNLIQKISLAYKAINRV